MSKPPAFQFYATDFLTGTRMMTLPERGAYITLICEQWDTGGVSDKPQDLARMLGCSKREAQKVWATVSKKFECGDDGLWRNPRLERVRTEQADYRAGKSRAGKSGADKRWQKDGTANSTEMAQPSVCHKQNDSSLSLSLSPPLKEIHKSPDPTTSTPSVPARASSSPLVMSPLRFERLKETHAFVGSRLRVPHVLHDELRTKLGGDEPESKLQAWYADLNTDVEMSREAIPDVFEWLRPKFKAWASASIADVELRKFVEGA